ncbi:MAG: hypothetical protein ABR925_03630 [Acidimicrobiales bacterium]|jgi:hypothetical protein
MGEEKIPIGTFDALLRDLLTWGLVAREETDGGPTWRLVDRAQQRLGALAIAREPWPVERTAYSGRRCADCHAMRMTWLRDGAYVCDSCWRARLEGANDEITAADRPAARGPRWVRHSRQKLAS